MAGNRLLGCQKVFFNEILIYASLSNVFLKNRKKSIFHIFFKIFSPKNAENSADRAEIGQIMLPTPPDTSKHFSKNFAVNNSHSLFRNPKKSGLALKLQKRQFSNFLEYSRKF